MTSGLNLVVRHPQIGAVQYHVEQRLHVELYAVGIAFASGEFFAYELPRSLQHEVRRDRIVKSAIMLTE